MDARTASQKVIVTPENVLRGKIATANQAGRFVVLTFPIGHLPALQQRLNVYRTGVKVGEVKVSGPQLDDNVVADVIAGEAEPGDEVSDR